MIAHIILGTLAATLTAIGSALFGYSFAEVALFYVVGGFVSIALSTTAQALRQLKPAPQPVMQTN
jgi:hypothetical protein